MNTPTPVPNGQAILAQLQADLAAAEVAVTAAGDAVTAEQTAAVATLAQGVTDLQTILQQFASATENVAVYEQQLTDAQASVNTLTTDKAALTQQVTDLTEKLAEASTPSTDAAQVVDLTAQVKTLTDAGTAKDAQIASLQQANDDQASGVAQDLGPVPDGVYDNNVTRRREMFSNGKIVMAVAEDIVGSNAFNLPSTARGVWASFPDVPRNSVKAPPAAAPA